MSKDTFKRTAPTIEFFKDGETIRAKKLGKIIEKIQDGMASLEVVVGDIHNRSILFGASPLFQNSIGRSIGQMDELTFSPTNEFTAIQKTKQTLHQGLIHWPNSSEAARVAGNQSMNLLPVIGQLDKVGIGCIRDDGSRCVAGYQTFYDKEKNLIQDASLVEELLLSGWVEGAGGGVTYDTTRHAGGGAQMDVAYRFNCLPYSENFEFWTTPDSIGTLERISAFDPNGQSATYKTATEPNANGLIQLALSGSGSESSADWCLSFWLAASGERVAFLNLGSDTNLPVNYQLLKGSLEGGVLYNLNISGISYLSIPISGTTWKRYWIHNNYAAPVEASGVVARLTLNISGESSEVPLYIFGAQLEPTNFPTTYRRTQGAIVSGLGGEVSLAYNLSVIPGHTYQVTMEGSGSISCNIDGSTLFTLSTSRESEVFLAETDNIYINAYVSGASLSTNYLTQFRVDPGTPCHAMNCPGFSAYDKIRSYRAVLPPITESGNQNFTQRLELPEEFQQALYNELPGNILGVFDHELNHAVPDRIVDWKLSNWPIGGLDLGGFLTDPEFLTDWTTSNGDTYPSELIPTTGSGVITRDVAVTSIVSTFTLPENPSPYMAITSGDQFARWPGVDHLFAKSIPATIEFLFRMHSGMNGGNNIAVHGGSTATLNQRTFLIYTSGGRIKANQESTVFGLSITTPLSSTDLRDDQWHHYALIIGNQPRILWQYVDGIFEGASSAGTFVNMDNFTLGAPALTGDILIGTYYHSINGYSYPTASGLDIGGFMIRGEFVYSGDPMSSLSFTPPTQSLFNSGTRPKSTPTQLSGIYIHWPFQEGSGQYVNDVGPSGHHLQFGTSTLNPSQDPVWVLSGTRVYTEYSSLATDQVWVAPLPTASTSYGTAISGFDYVEFYQAANAELETFATVSGETQYGYNQSFTMEAWFKFSGVNPAHSNNNVDIFSRMAYGDGEQNYRLAIIDGKVNPYIRHKSPGPTIHYVQTGGVGGDGDWDLGDSALPYVDDNVWHHVAFTVVKSAATRNPMYLYVDGVLYTSGRSPDTTDWNWTGAVDTDDPTVPDRIITRAGGVLASGNYYAMGEILVTSGIKYTGNFTPLRPLTETSGVILTHFLVDEGTGTSLASSGLVAAQSGLQLRTMLNASTLTENSLIPDWRWGAQAAVSGAVTSTYTTNYDWNQTMTIEGWFRVGNGVTSGTATGFVIGRTYDSTSAFDYTNWKIGINNGKYYANVRTQGSGAIAASITAGYSTFGDEDIENTVTSDDGLWHHVAATFTKSLAQRHPIKLFVDGVPVASGKQATSITFDFDWRIPQGEQNVLDLAVPSGMTMLIGSSPLSTVGFAFDELIVSSGIKYSGTFTPTTPLVSGSISTTLAKLRANEGIGTTLYNTGPTYQPPLQLRNLTSVANLDDITQEDWRWNSSNSYTTVSSSGTPIDRAIITVSGFGQKAMEHSFVLMPGRVYTWSYNVRANLTYSGIFETYTLSSGNLEVDLLLDSNFQTVTSSLENKYRVSVTEPGQVAWAEENPGNFWTIKRRLRTNLDNTIVKLTVGVSGNASSQTATFDSLDVFGNAGNSTIFKYQADPVLGLNWEGTAHHVTEENLIPWSTDLAHFNNNSTPIVFQYNILNPSGEQTAIRVLGTTVGQRWNSMDDFVDNKLTLQFWARSNNPSAGMIQIFPDVGNNTTSGFMPTSDWQQFSLAFSGWDRFTSTYFDINISGSTEVEFAWMSLHHGSGIVDYVPTNGKIDRRYKKVVRVKQYNQLDSNWTQAYGLIGGKVIQTTLIADTVNGLLFEGDPVPIDFTNFPASGVMEIRGQEIAYRGKYTDGRFIDCIPAWRGTEVDITTLLSGSVVTHVPLPRAIEKIEGDLIWFREDLPVADGGWANQFRMQIYNTQISNLDRFSLTASAIPLTRAAGSLMTAFMDHVADDARHFRRDQLCAALVDPSIYAGFDDMEVRLELVKNPVEELTQPSILNIFAFGFMNSNPKQITITWGDGGQTIITETGQYFDPVSHTYDLGAGNQTEQHTITVEIFDTNLHVARSNSIKILVTPTSKSSQTVRAYIITQPQLVQQSRTNIL